MEIIALIMGLRLTLCLLEINSCLALNGSCDNLKQQAVSTQSSACAKDSIVDSSVICKLQGAARLPAFSEDGDYIIGGVFSTHYNMEMVKHNYTTMPALLKCTGRIEPRELHFLRTMIFAIEEINNSSKLLPGIRLGYHIHDSCASVPMAVKVAFQLTNGLDPVFYTGNNCSQSGMVMAVVGDSASTSSISISRIIGSFNIPQVSHFATCACLSNKQQYPSFFRTIPSDQFQANALAKLVKQFGWTWIGAVRSDSDYGNNGMASFLKAAYKEGICVEYSESFNRVHPRSRIQKVADVIRRQTYLCLYRSKAMVVVAFVGLGEMMLLLEELSHEPSPPRQWIGSEGWVTHPDMLKFTFCAGAIGFGIPRSVIPGLRDFLLDLSPAKVGSSPILTEFWEDAFNCRLEKSEKLILKSDCNDLRLEILYKHENIGFKMSTWKSCYKATVSLYILGSATDKKLCNGSEDIQKLQSPYTDTSELRITNMVYKAVYAIAHAIHNAVCQETNSTSQCDKLSRIESKQVLTQLKKVNFSQNGYHVSFDTNGDPVAKYELVNWQKSISGSLAFVTVGYYDASLPVGQEFHIYKDITWMEGRTQVPVSVCSDSCPPGTHKVLQKGKPICCYDCIPCAEGEISNATDSTDCFLCPKEFWPNADRDTCFPKPVEFLSFNEVLGIILASFSVCGACLAVIITVVFFCHRTSPIVRANNSELSFLLLFSLTLCFLCSLTFIGAPSEWSCMLRHTAFGITFVLCISCVLGKTIVVLMAFKATLPGSNIMKWFGPLQQRMTVVSFTLIQVLICTVWLVVSPPFPMKNLTTYKDRIILECALGSLIGFWAVLGYIGLLAVFCFVLAVLARKLPDNFNEAKFITFSMLIFCAVWITFIPAYVSSPGKFTVAVEIFAILASSFGLILCIFAPKCYIILFKPEKNTKKHLMSKKE
ncbi:extracellular calcium-sensing receptor-like [Channa argus]|uniref:extracellular calcium-sensing receptor-like n=1 Tax=Channa argus TaxID=215402 RepID=UPI00352081EF